jgi:hypothetical protein
MRFETIPDLNIFCFKCLNPLKIDVASKRLMLLSFLTALSRQSN